jgi:hypothetical protein
MTAVNDALEFIDLGLYPTLALAWIASVHPIWKQATEVLGVPVHGPYQVMDQGCCRDWRNASKTRGKAGAIEFGLIIFSISTPELARSVHAHSS